MKDDCCISTRSGALLTGQQIACNHVNAWVVGTVAQSFESFHSAGAPCETTSIAESAIQQIPYHSGSDETARPCYEDYVVPADYKRLALCATPIALAIHAILHACQSDTLRSKCAPSLVSFSSCNNLGYVLSKVDTETPPLRKKQRKASRVSRSVKSFVCPIATTGL